MAFNYIEQLIQEKIYQIKESKKKDQSILSDQLNNIDAIKQLYKIFLIWVESYKPLSIKQPHIKTLAQSAFIQILNSSLDNKTKNMAVFSAANDAISAGNPDVFQFLISDIPDPFKFNINQDPESFFNPEEPKLPINYPLYNPTKSWTAKACNHFSIDVFELFLKLNTNITQELDSFDVEKAIFSIKNKTKLNKNDLFISERLSKLQDEPDYSWALFSSSNFIILSLLKSSKRCNMFKVAYENLKQFPNNNIFNYCFIKAIPELDYEILELPLEHLIKNKIYISSIRNNDENYYDKILNQYAQLFLDLSLTNKNKSNLKNATKINNYIKNDPNKTLFNIFSEKVYLNIIDKINDTLYYMDTTKNNHSDFNEVGTFLNLFKTYANLSINPPTKTSLLLLVGFLNDFLLDNPKANSKLRDVLFNYCSSLNTQLDSLNGDYSKITKTDLKKLIRKV